VKTVVLGGYGNFGRLIARALVSEPGLELIVAGRDAAKAKAFGDEIGASFARIDASSPTLSRELADLDARLLISTAGPFQGQDYRVARAAIDAGAHYIDIADGRAFVCGIGALDAAARAKEVLVVSGASSVPALSGAVVDHFAGAFERLDDIDAGICTSSRIPGDATVRAVLGYCGKPIPNSHGWSALRRHRFEHGGFSRWLCDCDVPDLELFPVRFSSLRRVRFGAGVEPAFMHVGLWMLARAVRWRLLPGLAAAAPGLAWIGRRFERLGSVKSAMFVRLAGTAPGGAALVRTWELVAEHHEGTNIPCMAAVRLARKLARGELALRGATPCLGLISLDEYLDELRPFAVTTDWR
jgi:hypothetical protein